MRVIIAGGRDFDDYKTAVAGFVVYALDRGMKDLDFTIISGGAQGADKMGEKISRKMGKEPVIYNAPWDDTVGKPENEIGIRKDGKPYWKKAGHYRNREMAENADGLLAFWDGKSPGTKNMIETARELGLDVQVINYTSLNNNSMKPRFGLNSGAVLNSLELKETKNGKPFVKALVMVGERKFYWFGFVPDRAWDKKENGWVTSGEAMETEKTRFISTLNDFFQAAGIDQSDYLIQENESIEEWVTRTVPLVKRKSVVDVFLSYEAKIREGNDRTWLELAKNNRFGTFIVESRDGKFKKELTSDDQEYLTYVNEEGEIHPFIRSNWYMNTDFAAPKGEIRRGGGGSTKGGTSSTKTSAKQDEPVFDDVNTDDDDLPF